MKKPHLKSKLHPAITHIKCSPDITEKSIKAINKMVELATKIKPQKQMNKPSFQETVTIDRLLIIADELRKRYKPAEKDIERLHLFDALFIASNIHLANQVEKFKDAIVQQPKHPEWGPGTMQMDYSDVPIAKAPFSTLVKKILITKANITRIGQLKTWSRADLCLLKGVSSKSLWEICNVLEAFGIIIK